MKLLGAYMPATAATGFTTEFALYAGAPGSAASSANHARKSITILGANSRLVFSRKGVPFFRRVTESLPEDPESQTPRDCGSPSRRTDTAADPAAVP